MKVQLSLFDRILRYTILLLLCCLGGYGQRDNIWVLSGGGVDFSSSIARFYQPPLDTIMWESSATICDPAGQLLFFTNGTHVWDRRGQHMPNGSALMGNPLFFDAFSTTQGALIVPYPQKSKQYIIFSIAAMESGAHFGKLFYSIVDMSLNGGYGDIIPGEKGILMDSLLTEKMTAVAGDNCNVWVLLRSRNENAFKAFEVTAAGISRNPVISRIGSFNFNLYHTGEMQFSQDGRKLAVSNLTLSGAAGLEVLDFNKVTGRLSNPIVLDNTKSAYYSACFSPDNTKVYAAEYITRGPGFFGIFQFDLNAKDPSTTRLRVDTTFATLSKIRLGPDRRLYYVNQGFLTSIDNPDASADKLKINKNQFFVSNGHFNIFTLPNVIAEVPYDTVLSGVRSVAASCWQSKVTLNASQEGQGYQWSDGSSGNSLTISDLGMYTLSYYTAPCTYHSDTFIVSFPHGVLPTASITEACNGMATGKIALQTYLGDTVQYRYTWYDQQDSVIGQGPMLQDLYAGTYRLLVQTAECDTLISFSLPESEYNAGFQADTLVCTGIGLSINNQSDPYFTQWDWIFGDGQQSREKNPAPIYRTPGIYEVTLIANGAICRDTFSSTVLVDAPLFPFELYADRDTLCPGESLHLSYPTDSTLVQYLCQFNGAYSFHTRDAFLQMAFEEPGLQTFALTAELRACPAQAVTKTIFIAPVPQVQLGSDTFLCLQGNAIHLSNKTIPQSGDQYLWSTGANTPTLLVRQPDNYQLRITNRFGCSSTEGITVYKDCYIDIPNVFTPNGDGINDYFFPRQRLSSGIATLHIQIWSRWGQLLFESKVLNGRGWDGKCNGVEQIAGTYVYQVNVQYNNGRAELLQGDVTLIR